MDTETHYCDYCGEYEVEQEGQHCSKDCSRGYWSDMNADKDDRF